MKELFECIKSPWARAGNNIRLDPEHPSLPDRID
jgi:hypothetical protein